jgi:hypothetical protein
MREYLVGVLYAVGLGFMSFYNMKQEMERVKEIQYKDNRFS